MSHTAIPDRRSIGYLKLTETTGSRIWRLYDADGREIKTGHCVDCVTIAQNRDMRLLTVH